MSHTRRIESGSIRMFQPERIAKSKCFAKDNQVTTLSRSLFDRAKHFVESLAAPQPYRSDLPQHLQSLEDRYVVRKYQYPAF